MFKPAPADVLHRHRTLERVTPDKGGEASRIRQLEADVLTTHEALMQTIEEHETSNKELQATNKEPLMVNEELENTSLGLAGRKNELTSVLETAPLVILVLDKDLQVSQATATGPNMFGLRRPMMHPHINQCHLPGSIPPLGIMCSRVIATGVAETIEADVDRDRVSLCCAPFQIRRARSALRHWS